MAKTEAAGTGCAVWAGPLLVGVRGTCGAWPLLADFLLARFPKIGCEGLSGRVPDRFAAHIMLVAFLLFLRSPKALHQGSQVENTSTTSTTSTTK